MRRRRGFTLVEIMIALVLSGLVSVGILYLARGQLRAHEVSDQLMRAQGNVRAGMQYVETVMRRACGGVSSGQIGINVGGSVAQVNTTCIRVYDGASTNGGSFTAGNGTTNADAIELLYPTTSPTTVLATPAPDLSSTSPQITVGNVNGFSVNDYVLVTDNTSGAVFKVAAITPSGTPTADGIYSGLLTFNTLTNNVVTLGTLGAGSFVFRVSSIAIYTDSSVLPDALMLDPDGMLGTSHSDAQPLVDGVIDFQIAVGQDANGDGSVTDSPDEWLGNTAGELASTSIAVTPWTNLRLLRATIMARTSNTYPGTAGTLSQLEDRATSSYASTGAASPRYRIDRVVVAPRIWSLAE